MKASPGRMRIALAALGAAAVLSACATGQNAQTANETPVIDGTAGQVGSITIRGIAVRAPEGKFYAKGADAPLQFIVANSGTDVDQLTDVTSTLSAGSRPEPATSTSAIPTASPSGSASAPAGPGLQIGAGRNVSVGYSATDAQVLLTALTEDLYPATSFAVTLTFATAGTVTIKVPVALREGDLSPSYIPSESLAPPE